MEQKDVVEITFNEDRMTISTIPAENAVHTDTWMFRECCLCGEEIVFYSKYGWLGHGNIERCDNCGTRNIQVIGEHGSGAFMFYQDLNLS